MSSLFNLIKKELREMMTPTTLVPMIMLVVIFMFLGSVINTSIDEVTTTGPLGKVGFVNNDTDDVNGYTTLAVDTVTTAYGGSDKLIVLTSDEIPKNNDEIMNIMREKDIPVLLVIEPGYSDSISKGEKGTITAYWDQSSSGYNPEATATSILYLINDATAKVLLDDSNMTSKDLSFISAPAALSDSLIMNGSVYEGYTPSDVTSAITLQNFFISIMTMVIIVLIGQVVIAGMGSEKENKTLETLLTLPMSRSVVVGGKIIGSAIVGLIFGCLFLVSIYFGLGSALNAGSGNVLGELGISLSILDWLVVGVFLFLSILCALGLCMIIGAFTKNYKAAQMLILPLAVLVMVPMFSSVLGLLMDTSSLETIMFVIPFSHPMTIMSNIIFGNTTMIIAGLVYLVAFTLATMYIAVRLYSSDILLTGFIKKNKGIYKWVNFSFSMNRK